MCSVESMTNNTMKYTISVKNGLFTCTCPDYEHRRSTNPGDVCKHIRKFLKSSPRQPRFHNAVCVTIMKMSCVTFALMYVYAYALSTCA